MYLITVLHYNRWQGVDGGILFYVKPGLTSSCGLLHVSGHRTGLLLQMENQHGIFFLSTRLLLCFPRTKPPSHLVLKLSSAKLEMHICFTSACNSFIHIIQAYLTYFYVMLYLLLFKSKTTCTVIYRRTVFITIGKERTFQMKGNMMLALGLVLPASHQYLNFIGIS